MTSTVAIACGLFALVFALVVIIAWPPVGPQRLVGGTFALASVATLAYATLWALLARRNSYVAIGRQGMTCRNWRGHTVELPWDAIQQLVLTESEGGTALAIRYLDRQGRSHGWLLMQGSSLYGPDIEPLKEAIMRRKTFPHQHERLTWWLAKRRTYEV